MKLILKLAWRNIWRNKRRSFLTLIAIAFATFSAIAMRGMQLGTYDENIKNAVEQFTGYLQIQPKDYQKNPSLNKTIQLSAELKTYLQNTNEITGYARRVYADGLISYKDNSFGSAIFGIIPNEEKNTTRILDRLDKGKFFSTDSTNEIVVGYQLLQNLGAALGDEVVILAQGYDGTLGNMKFKIVGTVKLGSYEFDAMAVFMGLKKSQDLLAMYNKISVTAVSLNSLDVMPRIQTELKNYVDEEKEDVLNWHQLMPELDQFIALDNVSGIFFLLILVVIVAFGILNTVLMSVTERFNEFGVTLAIGMRQIKLVTLIFIETMMLTLVGIILGDIIGYAINAYIVANPFYFSGELASLYEEYGFLPVMKSSLDAGIFISVSGLVLIVSIISSIYPAVKTYKLEPLKGIRYT